MKIDGILIASAIKEKLKVKTASFRRKNVIPHLAVILVGDDPSSISYIKRKQKIGEELGVKLSNYRIIELSNARKELTNLVNKLNKDKTVHGIIIQRPVPINISKEELDKLVIPEKDVDGFHPSSPYTPPVAAASVKILEWVYTETNLSFFSMHNDLCNNPKSFLQWLKKQKILIIGRGETGGRPIAKTFQKMDIPFTVAHSQTKNIKELSLASDIIISCVGKPDIVRHNMVTDKSTVIGIGLHIENKKLTPDYNQEEIGKKAAFYTPVPGGVGPVNVACLFVNLLISCETFGGSL